MWGKMDVKGGLVCITEKDRVGEGRKRCVPDGKKSQQDSSRNKIPCFFRISVFVAGYLTLYGSLKFMRPSCVW